MNKKIIYFVSLLIAFVVISCDNNIPDEQFVKRVALTKNGLQKYGILFTDEGKITLNFPVSVNGTSKNSNNVEVTIAVDPDTLKAYNFDRYRNNTQLYYKLPTENMYSFPKGEKVTIPAGTDYSIITLDIDLRNFDLYNNYILPLKISNTSVYDIAEGKYSKLLIEFDINNFISGSYTVSGNVWEEKWPDQKLSVTSTALYTLDDSTCYLYMGNIEEDNDDRSEYTMTIEVNKEVYEDYLNVSTNAMVRKYTDIKIDSKNTDKELTLLNNEAWVEQEESNDPYDNKVINLITRIRLKYSYMDLIDPLYPVKKIFEGTLSHIQRIDRDTGNIIN